MANLMRLHEQALATAKRFKGLHERYQEHIEQGVTRAAQQAEATVAGAVCGGIDYLADQAYQKALASNPKATPLPTDFIFLGVGAALGVAGMAAGKKAWGEHATGFATGFESVGSFLLTRRVLAAHQAAKAQKAAA